MNIIKSLSLLILFALYLSAYELAPLHVTLKYIGKEGGFTTAEANKLKKDLPIVYCSFIYKDIPTKPDEKTIFDLVPFENTMSIAIVDSSVNIPFWTVRFTFNKDIGDSILIGGWVELSIVVDSLHMKEFIDEQQYYYPFEEFHLADSLVLSEPLAIICLRASSKDVQKFFESDSLVLQRLISNHNRKRVLYPSIEIREHIEKKYETSDIVVVTGMRSNGNIARCLFFGNKNKPTVDSFSSEQSSFLWKNPGLTITVEVVVNGNGDVISCDVIGDEASAFHDEIENQIKSVQFDSCEEIGDVTIFRYMLSVKEWL